MHTLTQQNTKGEIAPTLQNQLDCWRAEVLTSYPTLARLGKSTFTSPHPLSASDTKGKNKVLLTHSRNRNRVMLVFILLASPWYYQWGIEW